MKKTSLFLFLALTSIILSGCGMAIKGVADTAIGGSCDLLVIESVQDLQAYDKLKIVPFTSSVGGHLNAELLAYLNDKAAAYNSEKETEQFRDTHLILTGTILHLTDGIYEKQILLQLEFTDSTTGQSLGLINVMGEANSLRGLTAAVDSLADSIADLLEENHFSGGSDPS